jgi:hypothetical protein
MSGVVLDVSVAPAQEPSFFGLLWSVLIGYVAASFTGFVLALPLLVLGWIPRPFARPGPFPVDGAWSFDADLVAAAAVVLFASWWIRRLIADKVRRPVSFGVVAFAVAATGYAPFLALRPAALSGVIALPATTWIIRRYAIGTTLPFPRPSWRFWAVLAVVSVAVFGSFQVYHPLSATGGGSRTVILDNSGWANLTILRVDGGYVGADWARKKLPYTVRARSKVWVSAFGTSCPSGPIEITFSVLGRTSTQTFTVPANLCGD